MMFGCLYVFTVGSVAIQCWHIYYMVDYERIASKMYTKKTIVNFICLNKKSLF